MDKNIKRLGRGSTVSTVVKAGGGQRLFAAVFAILLAVACCLAGCSSSSGSSTGTTVYSPNEPGPSSTSPKDSSPSETYSYDSSPSSNYIPAPTYDDPGWPTTNSQLLAVPESQRWYNAAGNVDTKCTIAGPVVNVYQATQSNGMPIFVQIGAKYPDPGCVEIVIWADYLDTGYESLLDDVSSGSNPWISVTGYLSSYQGISQFDTDDGPLTWTIWPDA